MVLPMRLQAGPAAWPPLVPTVIDIWSRKRAHLPPWTTLKAGAADPPSPSSNTQTNSARLRGGGLHHQSASAQEKVSHLDNAGPMYLWKKDSQVTWAGQTGLRGSAGSVGWKACTEGVGTQGARSGAWRKPPPAPGEKLFARERGERFLPRILESCGESALKHLRTRDTPFWSFNSGGCCTSGKRYPPSMFLEALDAPNICLDHRFSLQHEICISLSMHIEKEQIQLDPFSLSR